MKLLTLFALSYLLSISTVAAQTDHYEGIRWKNRNTNHFVLRANGTDHEPGKFQGRNQSTRSHADLDPPQGKLGIGMNDAFPVR